MLVNPTSGGCKGTMLLNKYLWNKEIIVGQKNEQIAVTVTICNLLDSEEKKFAY